MQPAGISLIGWSWQDSVRSQLDSVLLMQPGGFTHFYSKAAVRNIPLQYIVAANWIQFNCRSQQDAVTLVKPLKPSEFNWDLFHTSTIYKYLQRDTPTIQEGFMPLFLYDTTFDSFVWISRL
jgi:hypothetical protein